MPSFDSGYYAFTALIPLLEGDAEAITCRWQPMRCSPVQSLRLLLGSLRTVEVPDAGSDAAAESGGSVGPRPVPFSGSDRTHFARLVVVEELAWNGRERSDTMLELLRAALGWPQRQRIDRLPCPYLLVLLDFDAPDGSEASVENYLNELWSSMEQEWTLILRHCRGFDPDPQQRRRSYVELLLRHEIDSTFTYTGYGWAARQAGLWDPQRGRHGQPAAVSPPRWLRLLSGLSALVLALALLLGPARVWLVHQVGMVVAWLLLLPGVLLLPLLFGNGILRRAFQPWPAEPDTDLRSVLKALYLQRRFLELAEQCQQQRSTGSASLRSRFRAFLEETQPNDRDAPSLRPGSMPAILRSSRP